MKRRKSIRKYPRKISLYTNQNENWVRIRNGVFRTRNILDQWKFIMFSFVISTVALSGIWDYFGASIQISSTFYFLLTSLLSLFLSIIVLQFRSRYISRLATDIIESGNLYAKTQAASYFSDSGEFDKAASIFFDCFKDRGKEDYWNYSNSFSNYLDNITALPTSTKLNRLYNDAMDILEDDVSGFLDIYSVYLLSTYDITGDIHSSDFQDEYLNSKKKSEDMDENLFLLKTSIIDGVLEWNKGNWARALESLLKISKFKWSSQNLVTDLFYLLLDKSQSLDDPQWFILLSAFRTNTSRAIVGYTESLVTPIYYQWGLSGLISYMKSVGSLQNEMRARFAPAYRILVDVLDLAEKHKLKSFVKENLDLLLGFVGDDSYWHPSNVLDSILFSFFDDFEFCYMLLQEAISLVEQYPKLPKSISGMSKILGMKLRRKEPEKSIRFFETAISTGLSLSGRTIVYTSTTYLLSLYAINKEHVFRERVEEFLNKYSSDQDTIAVILSCAISESHEKDWIQSRDHLIEQYESIENAPSFAEGIINYVKYDIAFQEKRYESAVTLIEKSAAAYFETDRYRAAGFRFLHGGVLSWQYGISKPMKYLLDKALISFEKADEPWLQATVFAALNRWTNIMPIMKSRLEIVESELLPIDKVSNSYWLSSQEKDEIETSKKNLLFEKHVVELVIDACDCIEEIERVQLSETFERMNQVITPLSQTNIEPKHPAAAFVSALEMVLRYYSSLIRAIIHRRNGDFNKCTRTLEHLISNLDQKIDSVAQIHIPYLKTLNHFSKAQLRITRALSPEISDIDKVNAERSAIIDLKSVRNTFEELGMSSEVERIDRMLTGSIASAVDTTPYELLLRIPLLPEPQIEKHEDTERQKQIIVEPRTPFSAKRDVEKILESTSEHVYLLDTYIDEKTLDILLAVPKGVRILVLTQHRKGWPNSRFIQHCKDFAIERPGLEIRIADSTLIHDRFILTNRESCIIGGSLKDFGKSMSSMILLDEHASKKAHALFYSIWKQSDKLGH